MQDATGYIAQQMAQLGITKYIYRTFFQKLGNGIILPAGKYYFFDLSKLTDYQINANNTMYYCDAKKYYDLVNYSPLFHGQVHFIATAKVAPRRGIESDSSPSAADAVHVQIIEITPL